MAYKSTRRQWVKLWVNEWLDGTTRFKLTKPQRLLWIDLLALAGRSRFPGLIYAGDQKDGERVGYPISYLAGVLGFGTIDLHNALVILQEHGHIYINGLDRDSLVIGICNWDKYQSEYMRQKTYREVTPEVTSEVTTGVTTGVTTETTSRLLVEGEVDVEGEGEVEGEAEVECISAAAFASIGFDQPFGHPKFQTIWLGNYSQRGNRWLTQVMEATIQECQKSKVSIPPQFFEAKHEIERQENASVPKRVPL